MAKDELGINKDNLAVEGHDKYVETLMVEGHMVNVFENDYGQCYWYQFLDEKGELTSRTCGTYVTDYKNEIEYYFRPATDRLYDMILDLSDEVNGLRREINKMKGMY